MEKDKLLDDVKQIVDEIFAEKQKSSQMEKTQDALNESAETIENLTQSLEDTKAKLEAIQETATNDNEDKDSKISKLTTELEAAQKKVEDLETKLVSTEESLDNIKKDQLAEARIKELIDNKVAIVNNLEVQTAKVREMSEEEFSSYKEERIILRQAVEKELEEAAIAKATATASNDDTNSTEGGEEDTDITTPPAKIAPGQAIAAAMNFETNPSDDVKAKYADLGKAMAATIAKSDKKEI